MAKIIIYDSTETDRQQISEILQNTDHDWHFVEEKISIENIDPEAEVISVFVTSVVDQPILEAMPKLKLISCRSTGFNNIDLQAATDQRIAVTNVPTYGENTVAEFAFTLILALSKKLNKILDNDQAKQSDIQGIDLFKKTIGVIGSGRIGLNTIKIAKGFGMKVIAFDLYPNHQASKEIGYEYCGLDELVSRSDIVSIHAPYNDHTRHLVNHDLLMKMKNTAYLINTARGEIVDTKALILALNENQIAGAALDVIESEALLKIDEEIAILRNGEISNESLMHGVGISVLKKMPNVIITPHNAFNTAGAVRRINKTSTDNIVNFWHGDLDNKVN